MHVRISAATPEADLDAVVWPGVASVSCARCGSAQHIARADEVVTRLERLRGIRPGHIELQPVIESTRGVVRSMDIVASSRRVSTVKLGRSLEMEIGDDALAYARGECELHARALGLSFLDACAPHD